MQQAALRSVTMLRGVQPEPLALLLPDQCVYATIYVPVTTKVFILSTAAQPCTMCLQRRLAPYHFHPHNSYKATHEVGYLAGLTIHSASLSTGGCQPLPKKARALQRTLLFALHFDLSQWYSSVSACFRGPSSAAAAKNAGDSAGGEFGALAGMLL